MAGQFLSQQMMSKLRWWLAVVNAKIKRNEILGKNPTMVKCGCGARGGCAGVTTR